MFEKRIAAALSIRELQVKSTLRLFSEGSTVPFISRYRKEVTGNLDEVQIQRIKDLWDELQELEKRRSFILQQIQEQGKLTAELKQVIEAATELQQLEDLYLPYKPKKRSRADAAREKGLEPLATMIFEQKNDRFWQEIDTFMNEQVANREEALQGARDIMAEWISENAVVRGNLRLLFEKEGVLKCKVARGKKEDSEAQKFRDYFEYNENLLKCPSHRLLAMFRGEALGFLKISVFPDEERAIQIIRRQVLRGYCDATEQVKIALHDAWERLLQPQLQSEMLQRVAEKADEEAIAVFAVNARQLLLAPPLGEKRMLALDPGFRTGCKMVALDEKGNFLNHTAIYPHEPQKEVEHARKILLQWVSDYNPQAIAVGNGTAGRETEAFVKECLGDTIPVYMVNEAGASIYSAGEVAREEFPNLDVTVRGAISIGRRLMDPLAELVKIDPGNIGVGQYQHDVNKTLLKKRLDAVVESAVNTVGVNLNTASRHLLSYVSGLGPTLAQNIVEQRKKLGGFKSREQLKEVPRLGAKAFEQCAGFLRIRAAANALDNSAVHPERYDLVRKMAADSGHSLSALLSDPDKVKTLKPEMYVNELQGIGLPTLNDIIKELQKPGLDPRGEFQAVGFSDQVRSISDLESGLELNGIITNITDFGAFVDIGVKQDGLVHVSQLSNRFVKHPTEVVSLGQHVKVRVMDVDVQRKRISLTMKFN
ncbi:MAG: RNA-binding transcriptional accessory protein [Bacteroidetes bacterium]|nr:RNA-binding transcriptional accessory protein [Bacteroidota bacterium]